VSEIGPEHSVAVDLLGLALQVGEGRLARVPVLAHSVRGALLIDLALAGRITQDESGTQMDTTLTGWALADELLHDIDRHPTRTMSDLLQRGHPHLGAAIEELRANGRWVLQRRALTPTSGTYREVDPTRSVHLASQLGQLGHRRRAGGDPADAPALALALVCGLASSRKLGGFMTDLEAECGPVGWLVRDVTTFVVLSAAQDRAADFGGYAQFYV
jgi:hypothetical protein